MKQEQKADRIFTSGLWKIKFLSWKCARGVHNVCIFAVLSVVFIQKKLSYRNTAAINGAAFC